MSHLAYSTRSQTSSSAPRMPAPFLITQELFRKSRPRRTKQRSLLGLVTTVATAAAFLLLLLLVVLPKETESLSAQHSGKRNLPKTPLLRLQQTSDRSSNQQPEPVSGNNPRRTVLRDMLVISASIGSSGTCCSSTLALLLSSPLVSNAYTPDPDKLQESLYFISRVQEATVQQERFMNKLGGTQQLRTKLKLTLRLIDKNYKLLDQINYSSAFVTPGDKLVEASEAGYEAVDALQSAIEFVKKDENWSSSSSSSNDGDDNDAAASKERIAVLTESMQTCREQLKLYTEYMPSDKLRNARYRVEDENIRNRDEFDGDEDAGVYNPVNLPWKPVLKATTKTEAFQPPRKGGASS